MDEAICHYMPPNVQLQGRGAATNSTYEKMPGPASPASCGLGGRGARIGRHPMAQVKRWAPVPSDLVLRRLDLDRNGVWGEAHVRSMEGLGTTDSVARPGVLTTSLNARHAPRSACNRQPPPEVVARAVTSTCFPTGRSSALDQCRPSSGSGQLQHGEGRILPLR